MGFFPASNLRGTEARFPTVPRCSKCQLYRHCRSPKMPPFGEGWKGVLIVGEAPGSEEDSEGKPFIGRSGQFLRKCLDELGIDADRDCRITNAIICRPEGNRTPTEKEITHCRANLFNTIKQFQPHTIILLGQVPTKSLLGLLWGSDVGSIGRWVGWAIPSQRLNAWVCPSFHPAYLLRQQGDAVLERLFKQHLKRAVSFDAAPWPKGPPVEKVDDVHNPADAADRLTTIRSAGKPIAFDLECEGLKPERKDLRIVSCAVSTGDSTFAFPWHGQAIVAMKDLLGSDVPKWGHNCKYEERWIRRKLGIRVRNWQWDSMLAAHVLDNRPGITGLDFQAFVNFGRSKWDAAVADCMESKERGGNGRNRVREVDLPLLLRYNGLDALLTWRLCRKQMEEMSVGP